MALSTISSLFRWPRLWHIVLSLFVFLFFGFIFGKKHVCFGQDCIRSEFIGNDEFLFRDACIQVDDYFYTNRAETYEKVFFYLWWFKSTFYPQARVFVTDYRKNVISVIRFTKKPKINGEELDSFCGSILTLKMEQ